MKRNKSTARTIRHTKTRKGSSDYAAKVARGQMYGPGCCAHTKLGGVNHQSAYRPYRQPDRFAHTEEG